jgi:hypothetical protein
MKRRFALWGLSLLPVFLALDFGADLALGDQMFPSQTQSFTSCSGGGCTHFEGYVIVPRRTGAPETTSQAVVRPDAVLSANRLYLPMDEDKTP